EEILRTRRRRGGAILRAAIVLGECDQHGAALFATVGAARLQALQLGVDAVDAAAPALDLRIELGALRRLPAEQEKARALAAGAAPLRDQPVELGLLLG